VASYAITVAPRDFMDASPSAHSTSGASTNSSGVAPGCAWLAICDVDSFSFDGLPTYYATDVANWAAVGLARVTTASSVAITVDRVASDYTTPTARVANMSYVVRPSPAHSAADTSTMAADSPDCASCPTVDVVVVVSNSCPDSPVATPAPLPLEPGVAPANDCWVARMAMTFRGTTARWVNSRSALQHEQSVRPIAIFC
jgi:hypothetical protein